MSLDLSYIDQFCYLNCSYQDGVFYLKKAFLKVPLKDYPVNTEFDLVIIDYKKQIVTFKRETDKFIASHSTALIFDVPQNKPISNTEKLLASLMLEKASDRFSNHGCNEFSLELLPYEERWRLLFAMNEANGTPEDYDETQVDNVPDWWLMSYLSKRLKESMGEKS